MDSVCTSALVLTIAVFLTAGARAQPSGDDIFDFTLDELERIRVVVDVASFFNESELVVGSTVELITRESWRRRGARTVGDALASTPGVIILPAFFGGSQVAMRGFALNAATGAAINLDGVPINGLDLGNAFGESNGLQLGVFDRIEMVRGPGSAIYGADAFHGVVALAAFESTSDVIEIDGGIATNGYRQAALHASRGLTPTLRYSAAVAYSGQTDQNLRYDYTVPISGPTASAARDHEFDAVMATFKIHSDPAQRVSFRAGAYFNDQESINFPGNGTFQTGGVSALRDRDLGSGESDFHMLKGAVTINLRDDISIETSAFHWRANRLRTVDRSAQSPPLPFAIVEVDNDVNRRGVTVIAKQPTNAFNTQWVVGLGYEQAEVLTHQQSFFAPNGSLFMASQGLQDGINRSTRSLFAQARTSFSGGKLHLLYGGRVDDFSDFGVQTSPRAGVIYQPTPDSAVKLLYGHAFRPATAGEIGGSPAIQGDPKLEPETIDTFELAVMRHVDNWAATLTFFRSEWEDAITIVPLPPGQPFTTRRANVGANTARGVELSTRYVRDNFSLLLSGSYVRAEDTVNDVTLDAFPTWIFNLGVGWSPSANIDIHVSNRVHLGADEGEVVLDPERVPGAGTLSISPRQLRDFVKTDVNVTWHHAGRGLDIYLNALNVFDRDNYLPSPVNAEGGIADLGFTAEVGIRWRLK